MRFLLILSALLLITGPGLATAGPDAAGSPSAAPAPAATPAPPPPEESTPTIPPTIIRLPAPARSPANTLPPAHPTGTAQADLAGGPAQARPLTTFEAPDSLQASLETILQAIRALEKRLDALETAIRQLNTQTTIAPALLQSRKADMEPLGGIAANRPLPQLDPKATSSPTATADTVYVVQPGDTLNGLAVRFAVEKRRLIEFNRLETPDILTVGQRLRIPTGGSSRGAGMSPFGKAQ